MSSVSDNLGMLGFGLSHLDEEELSSILKLIIIYIILYVKLRVSKANMTILESHVSNLIRQYYIYRILLIFQFNLVCEYKLHCSQRNHKKGLKIC